LATANTREWAFAVGIDHAGDHDAAVALARRPGAPVSSDLSRWRRAASVRVTAMMKRRPPLAPNTAA